MFLVSLGKCQATDILTYDSIIKGMDKKLQRKSELEDEGQLFFFLNITDNIPIRVSSSSYKVLFYCEYWKCTWEPVPVMRRNEPI